MKITLYTEVLVGFTGDKDVKLGKKTGKKCVYNVRDKYSVRRALHEVLRRLITFKINDLKQVSCH